jgi:hypothetical protein
MNLLPDSIKYCIVNTTNDHDTKYYYNRELTYSDTLTILNEDDVRYILHSGEVSTLFVCVLFSYDGTDWRTLRPTFVHHMFSKPYIGRSQKVKLYNMKAAREFETFKAAVY